MKKFVLGVIRFYQKTAFFHKAVFRMLFLSDATCRFTPTCAEYTYQAIDKYGIGKGSRLGFLRIIRCHPWNKGGDDPLR